MNLKSNILVLTIIILLVGCKNDWDEHYNSPVTGSDENVWNALQQNPELSSFVSYLKQYQYDTLFLTNNTYTLFAPTNDAIAEYLAEGDSITEGLLAYHVSKYFVQTASIEGKRKIQTFMEKFSLFNYQTNSSYIDDIPLILESPAYRNGKYFVIDQVAKPKPNLYEYIALTNPVLKAYIDSEDSVILDKTLSTPIGFDEDGNTIYDSVVEIINMFEVEFFKISEEFRNRTATIVFPKKDNYEAALTAMAQEIGAGYASYEDIPMDWQNEVLIPYLLEHGVFENMVEREEFLKKAIKDTVRLKNILGDSVVLDYEPGEKTICSNGYAYNYADFVVPDTLYKAAVRFEAEWLLKNVGASFVWHPFVKNISSTQFAPSKTRIPTHSNDTVIFVNFYDGYSGTYSLEFNVENLFPRKYLAVFHISPIYGGIYDIFVNGQLVRTFNYGTEISAFKVVNSVIPNKKYFPKYEWTKFDFWVDNLETYGQAVIKIIYKGPGTSLRNGLGLDYIDFIPY